MNKNISRKNTILLYAVMLFTCAFIVLLLTAYSQKKFNKNINEYKNQLSMQENEKIKFRYNVDSLLEENKKLDDDVSILDKKVTSAQDEIIKKGTQIKREVSKQSEIQLAYDILNRAEEEYKNDRILECATLISPEYNYSLLSIEAQKRYKSLSENCFQKAALLAYNKGYQLYQKGQLTDAIQYFNLSVKLEQNDYFSDDCYFYLAWVGYRIGDKNLMASSINTLLEKYPKSNYKNEILILKSKS